MSIDHTFLVVYGVLLDPPAEWLASEQAEALETRATEPRLIRIDQMIPSTKCLLGFIVAEADTYEDPSIKLCDLRRTDIATSLTALIPGPKSVAAYWLVHLAS